MTGNVFNGKEVGPVVGGLNRETLRQLILEEVTPELRRRLVEWFEYAVEKDDSFMVVARKGIPEEASK